LTAPLKHFRPRAGRKREGGGEPVPLAKYLKKGEILAPTETKVWRRQGKKKANIQLRRVAYTLERKGSTGQKEKNNTFTI